MITVKDAQNVARQWVLEEASHIVGYVGAYFAGSVGCMADDALLSPHSDLDVHIVVVDPRDGRKHGKFIHQGVLLEVSYIPSESCRSFEAVLGNYHLAHSFSMRSIIHDPTGVLTLLQEKVLGAYSDRTWVRKRCEHAASRVLHLLRSLDDSKAVHDQVASCIFAAGVTTHILLVAALENPTVRRRYVAVRKVLEQYGRLNFQESLLAQLGCVQLDRKRIEHHLNTLASAFDVASSAIRTPYRFGSDISSQARSISIDGSREFIEAGFHREAVFWIVATYCRCRTVFAADAPERLNEFDPAYQALLDDLDIGTFPTRMQRCVQVEAFLPQVMALAAQIQESNPKIRN